MHVQAVQESGEWAGDHVPLCELVPQGAGQGSGTGGGRGQEPHPVRTGKCLLAVGMPLDAAVTSLRKSVS